jgi:hypothetical protein
LWKWSSFVFPLIFLTWLYGMGSYSRDPIAETYVCSSLLILSYGIRTRTVVVEKCSLWVELCGKTIKNHSIAELWNLISCIVCKILKKSCRTFISLIESRNCNIFLAICSCIYIYFLLLFHAQENCFSSCKCPSSF